MTESDYKKLTDTTTDAMGSLFKNKSFDPDDELWLTDREWVTNSYLTETDTLPDLERKDMYRSSADFKITDGSLGGSLACNSKPQFTRYADIRRKGRLSDRNDVTIHPATNIGMGRYYSEALDDNSTLLYLEFGVPEFNSLLRFFGKAIDTSASILANKGRLSYSYMAGRIVGTAVMFYVFPIISLVAYGIKLATNLLLGDSTTKFYTIKPAHHLYWNSVNTIVTSMTIDMGIMAPVLMSEKSEKGKLGVGATIDKDYLEQMKALMPEVITEDNYIDVYAIANRAQVRMDKQLKLERKANEANGLYADKYIKYIESKITNTIDVKFKDFLKDISTVGGAYSSDENGNNKQESPKSLSGSITKNSDGSEKYNYTKEEETKAKSIAKYMQASAKGGNKYAIFEVEHVGPLTDSFSNTTQDVPVKDKLNSVAATSRDIRFSMAGGNIAGEFVKDITDAISEFGSGGIESVTFGLSNLVQGLMGNAFIDVPKMWGESDTNLASVSYKIPMMGPSAHPIAHLKNFFIPIAMMLAGTLPQETGKSSHTSPLLCRAFARGIQNIEIGIITDVSITRGTSNLSYNNQGRALGYEMTVTITDLSPIMVSPVNPDMFSLFNMSVRDDTALSHYIGTITGKNIYNTRYSLPKMKLRLAKTLAAKAKLSSGAYWGSLASDTFGFSSGGIMANGLKALLMDDDYQVAEEQRR